MCADVESLRDAPLRLYVRVEVWARAGDSSWLLGEMSGPADKLRAWAEQDYADKLPDGAKIELKRVYQ